VLLQTQATTAALRCGQTDRFAWFTGVFIAEVVFKLEKVVIIALPKGLSAKQSDASESAGSILIQNIHHTSSSARPQ
jgi:hypothetical protein